MLDLLLSVRFEHVFNSLKSTSLLSIHTFCLLVKCLPWTFCKQQRQQQQKQQQQQQQQQKCIYYIIHDGFGTALLTCFNW